MEGCLLHAVAFGFDPFTILPVTLAFLGQSGPALGGFVIETVSTGPTLKTTDFSIALAIPKFDTTLGTLQDVVISYSDTSSISGSLTKTSASSQSFKVSESTVYSLTLGSNLLLTNTLTASQGYTSLAPFHAASFGAYTPSGSAGPLVLTSGSIFQAFDTATSNIIVDFSTLTTTKVVGGGGNVSTGIYTWAGASVTVRYDYATSIHTALATVPEPSSVAMTALGGLLAATAGWVRRRRCPGLHDEWRALTPEQRIRVNPVDFYDRHHSPGVAQFSRRCRRLSSWIAAIDARIAARLVPTYFSTRAEATSNATTFSTITLAAGTAQTSDRS